MRHVIPISGKDSLATAILQMTRQPNLPYELFFNDVGAELPETYEWLDRVEIRLDRKITRVGKSLEKIIAGEGFLPSMHVRFCIRKSKIKPMEEWIGGDETTVYFGIRADEDRGGYQEGKRNIIPCYPLKELGVTLNHVYAVVDKFDLRPPRFFWKRLHDEVLNRIDTERNAGFKIGLTGNQVLARISIPIFDRLFAWRSRPNCYFCFFQPLYEWVGLLEHHPDLFYRAEALENKYGSGDRREEGQSYTWIQDYPLSRVKREREQIFAKRVKQIIKMLETKQEVYEHTDLLQVTSCGLFCGK